MKKKVTIEILEENTKLSDEAFKKSIQHGDLRVISIKREEVIDKTGFFPDGTFEYATPT